MKGTRSRWFAAALVALFVGAASPGAWAAFRSDFSGDAPGERPAAAGVGSGPGRRAIVVDENTDPPDPFGPAGNRSLMLENNTPEQTSNVTFAAEEGLAKGTFALAFWLEHSDEEGGINNTQLSLALSDGGTPAVSFRRFQSFRIEMNDGAETVRLDNRPLVNSANLLIVHFDAEQKTFRGTLNGEALAFRGKEEFAFAGEAEQVDRIAMRPGHRALTRSRAFIDHVELAPPGAVDEAALSAKYAPPAAEEEEEEEEEEDFQAVIVDFSGETPGEPPAAAERVASGPDRRAIVVDEATDPRDPFQERGNRSLMLENSTRNVAPSVVFDAGAGLERGAFAMVFWLEHSVAEDGEERFDNSQLSLHLSGDGVPAVVFGRFQSHRIQMRDGGETVRLANRPYVNRPNLLWLRFDAEEKTFSGTLNGHPLARGDRTVFDFAGEAEKVDSIALGAGHSGIVRSRVFVDSLELAHPGEIDKEEALAELPVFNMLPNASFEETDIAREVYPITAEYRHPGEGQWSIDHAVAFHGERSLRMDGTSPYFWQVMGLYSDQWVFSVHLKGARPGQRVEVGLEKLEFGNESGIWVRGRQVETVEVGEEWERFALAGEQDDAEGRGNPNSMGRNQYRAWVRPLDPGPLWVDAAQLERGRLEPSAFDPVRRGNDVEPFMLRLMASPLVDLDGPTTELAVPEDARPGRGTVPLAVRETAGAERRAAPVWGGVPFPRGELFDADAVRLADEAGREVPVQTKVLAHWPRDASIRSLLVDFQADVPAGGARHYSLHYGDAPAEAGRPLARDDGEAVVIDTGKAVFTVPKDAFRWFGAAGLADESDLPPGSYVVGLDGTLYGSAWGAPDEFAIETNGPVRAVVMFRGRHWSQDGERSLLDYEARIHAFAGSNLLYIKHTFENREPQLNTPVRSHFLRLPVSQAGAGEARFGLLDAEALVAPVAPGQPATITQVKDYYGEGRFVLVQEHGPEGAGRADFEHRRASGWVQAGAAALAVEDFWQLDPKAVRVEADAVNVYHWPEDHVRFADLPWGVSNTMRLAYAPFGAEVEAGRNAGVLAEGGTARLGAEPLLLQPDARWTGESGVFGHFISAEEGREKFPGVEFQLDRFFGNMAIDREVTDLTGMWDYGCLGTPQGWLNNETAIARNLWLQYLRTNDPALYRRAWIKTRHFRDVDIMYGGPGSRIVCHHAGGFHTSPTHHTGHYWITGVVWHYLLTGDMLSRRVALETGANLMTRGLGDRRGRNRARPLYHLAEFYELSQLEQFREAFEFTYGFVREGTTGGPMPASSYHGGKELQAATRWYDITGDPKFREDMVRGAEAILERHSGPDVRAGGGRNSRFLDALAGVALRTGDPKFVSGVYDLFVSYTVALTSFSDNTVRAGAAFLYAADRLGVTPPETLPDYALGIPPFTGQTIVEPLRVRVAAEPDEPVTVKIYFTREGRRRENDAVEYRVESPGGEVVAEGAMSEGERGGVSIVHLPAVAGGGDYLVTLNYRGNAQGEISASTPRIFLDGSTPFAIRRILGRLGLVHFWFIAPQENPTIAFTSEWHPAIGAKRGETFAVMLRDRTGETVAHRRWLVPAGTVYDASGRLLEDAGIPDTMELKIPERHRGEPLSMTMFPVKWMRWQWHGLEDTRLGPTLEAFGER